MNAPLPQTAPHADIKTIAEVLGVSRSRAAERATKESWPFEVRKGRGGKKYFYPIATLPKGIARKVQAKAAILAMKSIQIAKMEKMPDIFLAVLDDEVYEVRKVQP